MTAPLVSLIMPARNHAVYVETALLSLLHQTYAPCEIIVIDDGSSDATPEVIAALLARHDPEGQRVRFLRQANRGLAATLGRALDLAQGEFVQFLASDDALFPQATAWLVAAFAKAPADMAAISCDGYVFDGLSRGHLLFSELHPTPKGRNQYREMMVGNWLPAMGMLYRRAALVTAGGFDPALVYEDWGLLLALTRQHRIGSIPDRLFLYRQHGRNISHDLVAMTAAQAALCARHPAMQSSRRLRQALQRRDALGILRGLTPGNLDQAWRFWRRERQRRAAEARYPYWCPEALSAGVPSETDGPKAPAEGFSKAPAAAEAVLRGPDLQVDPTARLLTSGGGQIHLGQGCQIGAGVELRAEGGTLVLGPGCQIEAGARLVAGAGGLSLGAACRIGPGAVLESGLPGSRLGHASLMAEGARLSPGTSLGAFSVLGPGVTADGHWPDGSWWLTSEAPDLTGAANLILGKAPAVSLERAEGRASPVSLRCEVGPSPL